MSVLAGCASQPPGAPEPAGDALVFDPCSPVAVAAPGASDDQLASIDSGLALWRAQGTGLVRGDPPEITIAFRDAAAAIYGFYDDTTATVYVNIHLADDAQRAITVAHELGHALGLVHIAPAIRASVMNPGNLTIEPNDGDRVALARRWGSCNARNAP